MQRIFIISAFLFSFVFYGSVYAQGTVEKTFAANPRAVSAVLMKQDQSLIHLWGVEATGSDSAVFKLQSRMFLDNAIGREVLKCEAKGRGENMILARCFNHQSDDLGLMMVRNGYAVVDRSVIYGSFFEESYIRAEKIAQHDEYGVWKTGLDVTSSSKGRLQEAFVSGPVFGIAVLVVMLIVFSVLTVVIMRGFQKVIKAQKENFKLVSKEREIRRRERDVVASMVESELKANKSKIDAYVVVYEETLSELRNTNKIPRYQKLGDIIQKQPNLHRSIFDKNADKLDVLGKRLTSDLIHFYARVKSNPDYETIEPETDLNVVIKIVEEAIELAKHLNALADDLLKRFEDADFESADDVSDVDEAVS